MSRRHRTAPSSDSYLSELWKRRDFTTYLALGNIRSLNASTTLGLFWWVLNPLANAAIYYLVLGIIFGAGESDPTYFPYLLSGIFIFFYTQDALISSSTAIVNNANMLLNIAFPRLTLVISANLQSAFGFLASMVAYFALALPQRVWPGKALAALPLIVILHTVFNVGLGALMARLTIPFRDLRNVLPHVMRIWLYLSPALYEVDRLPDLLRAAMVLNPMAPFLDLYRWALMGRPVEIHSWGTAILWSVFVSVGVVLFIRSEDSFARYL